MKRLELGVTPGAVGETPEKMLAAVIRKEREGEPTKSMLIEEVTVPEVGPGEVLVLTMAAGVNFNGVWAARGRPVSVFKMHKEPFHTMPDASERSEEHTSELQSLTNIVCRLLLEKKKSDTVSQQFLISELN